ncbi:MAG TPA: alpha/beta fold hydrolase [Planctomycetota bacterium]
MRQRSDGAARTSRYDAGLFAAAGRRATPLPLSLQPPPVSCRAPWWARGGHPQTFLGHLLPSGVAWIEAGRDGYASHEIGLDGGDRLSGLHRAGTSGVLVHVFHGLGGHVNSDYSRRIAKWAAAAGHGVLAVNHRGCGAGRGKARGAYHSGSAGDLAAVTRSARERWPGERHVAIGISLSGNALLLQLARDQDPPDAAIAVNPPIDLAACSERIDRGLLNKIYQFRFVRLCRQAVRERDRAGLLDARPDFSPWSSLREVDDAVTAPIGGFADADDYYRRCSTQDLLAQIQVPTVILTAVDDPFVVHGAFETARLSPQVHLHSEDSGGHVGYLHRERTPLGTRRWLDYALAWYLEQLLGVLDRPQASRTRQRFLVDK